MKSKPWILKTGDPNCKHYEAITTPELHEHEIGTCILCGRVTDYTLWREEHLDRFELAMLDNPLKTLCKGVTLEKLMLERTGAKCSK